MAKPFPNYPSLVFLFSLFLISHVCTTTADVKRSVYIVHMDKSHMPLAFSTHHHWYSSILSSAIPSHDLHLTSSDPNTLHKNLIYVYDNAFHGFSALLSHQEADSLNTIPGFISSYRDTFKPQPETTRSVDFLGLSTASGLWPASQQGKDVIIGFIDSGIWPESPSFRDTGLGPIPARWKGICQEGEQFNSSHCNRKLIGARYFNRAILAEDPNITIPMNSARDTDGHGTHVASTAAGSFVNGVSYFGYANGTARGVAPAARLAAYKVLWPVGGGGGAETLAGIDQAVADGVDIISISLGASPNDLYENPLSIASFGAREKGIVVVFSAGNRGPGIRTIREKGIPWGIVVAAGTVDRWFTGRITLGNGKSITGWSMYPGRASVRNLPIVYSETLAACDAPLPSSARRGILVCNSSTETNMYGLDNALSYLPGSGARAGIIIGEVVAEDPSFYRTGLYPFPMTVIKMVEGRELIKYVSSTTNPRATITFHETVNGPGGPWPAPALGSFSSRGPARNLPDILKPDIMAPGMLILAAYPPNTFEVTADNRTLTTNYPLLWGTSMACPHISGVAALLKAAHPDWSPSAIQSAMMTTASTLNNANQPIREIDGMLATPLDIGSGHVDPNRALNPGLVYDNSPQDFVNFVCALNFTANQTRTLIRSNYNCSTPSFDLNYPSLVATFHPPDQGRTLTKRYMRIVTNVGDGAATYTVRVEAPINSTVTVRPQRLVFGKKYEKQSYSVRVRFVADIDTQHRSGAIIWRDRTGKYSVRIPMMISAGPEFFE